MAYRKVLYIEQIIYALWYWLKDKVCKVIKNKTNKRI